MRSLAILSFVLSMVLSLKLVGQNESSFRPDLNFKVGTVNFLNDDYPSMNLAVEFFPLDKFSLHVEYGKIYQPSDRVEQLQSGSKRNIEFRFYPVKEANEAVFMGLKLHHRKATISGRYTLGYECDPFDFRSCTYYTDFRGNVETNFYAYQLVFGHQYQILKNFFTEAYMGVGESTQKINRSTVNGGSLVERNRLYDESYFERKPSLSIRFNFVYFILRKE